MHRLKSLSPLQFPGCHINVGGGSDDGLGEMKGDSESRSRIQTRTKQLLTEGRFIDGFSMLDAPSHLSALDHR